mmetsp:Transcript_27913/g.75421  ORF Transcript_27913/g.75421 Transcript_27913/m.75421 type:complete len:235 (+) Transcript_27913:761-1465(+)
MHRGFMLEPHCARLHHAHDTQQGFAACIFGGAGRPPRGCGFPLFLPLPLFLYQSLHSLPTFPRKECSHYPLLLSFMPLLLLIPQMLLLLAPLTPLQPQELGSLPPVPHQIAACKVSVNRQEHCHAKKDHLQDECGTPGHQRRCTIDEFRCHPQSNLCIAGRALPEPIPEAPGRSWDFVPNVPPCQTVYNCGSGDETQEWEPVYLPSQGPGIRCEYPHHHHRQVVSGISRAFAPC